MIILKFNKRFVLACKPSYMNLTPLYRLVHAKTGLPQYDIRINVLWNGIPETGTFTLSRDHTPIFVFYPSQCKMSDFTGLYWFEEIPAPSEGELKKRAEMIYPFKKMAIDNLEIKASRRGYIRAIKSLHEKQ